MARTRPQTRSVVGWEQAFMALMGNVQPVLVIDETGDVRRLSRPLGGLRPSDMVGRRLQRAVAPSHTRAIEAAIQNAFGPGHGQVVDAPVLARNGQHWYRFHVTPWRGGGSESAAFVHCTDIQEERQELTRLRIVERLMRDTEGMSHVGVWTWDISKPHAEWSDELYRIYGLDPDTHVPTYDDYLGRVHPDDVERVRAATQRVFNDHRPYSHDERIRRTDGTWRHLHTWARPVLDDNGQLDALHGVCMDITDRKEAELALVRSEDRQKTILESARLGIASIRQDGTIEDANPAFLSLLHAQDVPCELWEILPEEGAAGARELIAQVLDGGQTRQTVLHLPEHDRWLRLILSPARDQRASFAVAVVQDVSAEHAAAAARRRIKDLEAQRVRQARMIGVASHELKNPLTPIVIQLELLRRGAAGELSEDQVRALDRIERQTDHLQTRLHELLDASRAEAGHLRLEKEKTDLTVTVRDAVTAHMAEAKDFGVELELDAPTPVEANVDAARIAQVVDNLVANALRFTPSGRSVRVRLRVDEAEARIVVEDEGVGIPVDRQDDLFAAYADGAEPVHPGRSNGLGLYIVKSLIEGHGGTVDLESKPGHGTRITVRVPL